MAIIVICLPPLAPCIRGVVPHSVCPCAWVDARPPQHILRHDAIVQTGIGPQGARSASSLSVREIVRRQSQAERLPMRLQDEEELLGSEWTVLVDEPHPGVELGIAGEALLKPRHADQDDANSASVVVIPKLLEAGRPQAVGIVHDHQRDIAREEHPNGKSR